jgi:hypothetical protein
VTLIFLLIVTFYFYSYIGSRRLQVYIYYEQYSSFFNSNLILVSYMRMSSKM